MDGINHSQMGGLLLFQLHYFTKFSNGQRCEEIVPPIPDSSSARHHTHRDAHRTAWIAATQ